MCLKPEGWDGSLVFSKLTQYFVPQIIISEHLGHIETLTRYTKFYDTKHR